MSEVKSLEDELFDIYEKDNTIIRSLKEIYEKGRQDAEAEQKAMCESCIHKVSADDIDAIRNSAIDECIEIVERYTYDCSIIAKLEKLKESKQ